GLALAARQYALAWRVAADPIDNGSCSENGGRSASSWPSVTVLVPAHNEEGVLPGCLAAMADLEYPRDRLDVLVIDDRSTDRTGELARSLAARDGRFRTLHRKPAARPGKAAAVADGTILSTSDVLVLFDADYLPPP